MPYKITVFSFIVFFILTDATAQRAAQAITPTDLYTQIFKADSSLFDAFNHCDSATYKKYFTDDLEFYHDIGGLSVGIQIEMQAFAEMCTRGNHIRRVLLKNSLEVHPIKDYGAVEIGIHQFFHTNKGEPEKPSGTYKFVQVWKTTSSGWKLSRVISYGHDTMHSD